MAGQMTKFDVVWRDSQQKWYHLKEQAQGCALIERTVPSNPLCRGGGMNQLVRPRECQHVYDVWGSI